MWVLVPVLILLLRVKGGAAADVRQLLAQGSTSLSNDDMVVGGACGLGSGCRSEVVSARALVLGKPRPSGKNCAVADENSFDSFALSDIDGATLHVMHRCEDAAGKLWDEVSCMCFCSGFVEFYMCQPSKPRSWFEISGYGVIYSFVRCLGGYYHLIMKGREGVYNIWLDAREGKKAKRWCTCSC